VAAVVAVKAEVFQFFSGVGVEFWAVGVRWSLFVSGELVAADLDDAVVRAL
jgi:hypothetical protein